MSTLESLRGINFSSIPGGFADNNSAANFPISVVSLMFKQGTQKGILAMLLAESDFWDRLCANCDQFQWITAPTTLKVKTLNSRRLTLKYSPFVLEANQKLGVDDWNFSLLSQQDREHWDYITTLNQSTKMYCQLWLSVVLENVKLHLDDISEQETDFLIESFEVLMCDLYHHNLLEVVNDQLQIKAINTFTEEQSALIEEDFRVFWTAALSISEEVVNNVYSQESTKN